MARESPAYRDNLAMLNEAMPGKVMLTVTDVQRALNTSRGYAQALVGEHLVKGRISKITLARMLAK